MIALDDPFRTAAPWCAPGEIDPGDVPTVAREAAVERVADVLAGRARIAFGDDAAGWSEVIADHLADVRQQLHLALLSPYCPSALREIRRDLERFVHARAIDWLAEADNDELEQEGFR